MDNKSKKSVPNLQQVIVENVRQLMNVNELSQADLWKQMYMESAKISRILSYQQAPSLSDIEKFAAFFEISVIDLITYPERYVKENGNKDPLLAVTIQVTKENRDLLLKFLS